ncbi:MAG: RNA methyltransferase [Thermoprotei archaeon]|nr:MAG: RNA methyltransferase [Thermoprotei archaeon]RLE99478.1 MAG: RNA methyltransferase [Thermoprotei archaeon]
MKIKYVVLNFFITLYDNCSYLYFSSRDSMRIVKILKKSDLKKLLSTIKGPQSPSIELEQYETPVQLASDILWTASTAFNDIPGKIVVDLGCGTGRLALGAALLGAHYVIGVDVDFKLVKDAKNYARKLGLLQSVEFIVADVRYFWLRRKIDTVLQNPPFGVHRRGADLKFLDKALEISRIIYTIHKAATADFIEKHIKKKKGTITLKALGIITIPRLHRHYKRRVYEVQVVVYRVSTT